MGTVGYMSPEQVRGCCPRTHRSDIFSFGAILYEMLSGSAPSRARRRPTRCTRSCARTRPSCPAPDRASLRPSTRVVRHCLEKSPDERFQSARDLAFDLQAITETSGVPAAAGPREASAFRPAFLAGRRTPARGFRRVPSRRPNDGPDAPSVLSAHDVRVRVDLLGSLRGGRANGGVFSGAAGRGPWSCS